MALEREQLGKPGVIAIGIGLFCLSFYAGTVAPLTGERDRLHDDDMRLTQEIATASDSAQPFVEQSSITLPPLIEAAALPEKLAAASSAAGFSVDHVALTQTDEEGLRRIEVAFPLKGSYAQIRDVLRAYLHLSSVVTLDELSLHRGNGRDPALEVTLRLSYYYALRP